MFRNLLAIDIRAVKEDKVCKILKTGWLGEITHTHTHTHTHTYTPSQTDIHTLTHTHNGINYS